MSSSKYAHILNNIPLYNENIVSLERIMELNPFLTYQSPMLYIFYLNINKQFIDNDEQDELRNIIARLKYNLTKMNEQNMQYMNRHLVGIELEIPEDGDDKNK
jgi:hypothetical protein